MARMTDRDALLEKVTKLVADGGTSDKAVGEIIIAITEAPTVDAVEVVRCKDCKHYMLWEDSEDKKTCAKSIGLMVSDPDDFCSYGERRTDNG